MKGDMNILLAVSLIQVEKSKLKNWVKNVKNLKVC